MADFEDRLARAREHVIPVWTSERERAVRAQVDARLERSRQRRVVALSFASLALVVGGLFASHRIGPKGIAAVAVPTRVVQKVEERPSLVELLHLEDGSSVSALNGEARADPIEVGPNSVAVRLSSGAARFSVTPNPVRTFRVVAGDTTILVLGTVFTVAIGPDGVRVGVERGRVHVEWSGGERNLGVGEQTLAESVTPPREPVAPLIPLSALALDTLPADHVQHPAPSASQTPNPSWRAFAEDGDYGRAFARLSAEGPAAVRDEPGDLLLAADVARLGSHPEKAIAPLERVLSAHAGDSRAPLAAFTLGRTLLDQLGRPREAARAFATARRLDSRGAVAEDALAREVESWSRAGDAEAARDRAEEYTTLYPKGRRLLAVRRLGGLD